MNFFPMSQLPEFLSLKRIFWTESYRTSRLLRRLIPLARNVEHLYLTQSIALRMDDTLDFSALPNLQRLGLGIVGQNLISSILQFDLQNLTRLNCSPSFLNSPNFPVLRSLRRLEVFGSRSTISFRTIFSRCPRLQELSYDVWNSMSEPEGEPAPLACIRLHSAVSVVRDWTPIETHFGLFISTEFPRVPRLVLHGTWHRVVTDPLFARFQDGLRARGWQFEFPEGNVR
ncbi:hypothetical protein C8R47DRAFT_1325269 [Mycena vitilis]|nr:hypothetical protein C8R47DRAFT_1325269 [Mycena vitilis]